MPSNIVYLTGDCLKASATRAGGNHLVPSPYDTLVDPADVELPPAGDEARRPDWHAEARRVFRTAEATEADLRKLIATYYGMIAHLDHQMERVHQGLEQRDMLPGYRGFDKGWE